MNKKIINKIIEKQNKKRLDFLIKKKIYDNAPIRNYIDSFKYEEENNLFSNIDETFQNLLRYLNKKNKPLLGNKLILQLIFESVQDLYASFSFALMGFYKIANSSLRSSFENVFRIVYFNKFPDKLSNFNAQEYFRVKDRLLKETFSDTTLIEEIKMFLKQMGSFVHTSPEILTSRIAYQPIININELNNFKVQLEQTKNLIFKILNSD